MIPILLFLSTLARAPDYPFVIRNEDGTVFLHCQGVTDCIGPGPCVKFDGPGIIFKDCRLFGDGFE